MLPSIIPCEPSVELSRSSHNVFKAAYIADTSRLCALLR